MRTISTCFILAIAGSATAITSPLPSVTDYRFTEPVHTNFIKGRILGPDPEPFSPVRGEDLIYLYEAYAEMSALLSSRPDSSLNHLDGIDTAHLRINYAALLNRPAYQALYYLFQDNTNGNRDVLIIPSVSIQPATNLVPTRGAYVPYYVAADAALASTAAVCAPTNLLPLGIFPRRRRIESADVAAYYLALGGVSGVARDFGIEAQTNHHLMTVHDYITEASLINEKIQYNTIDTTTHWGTSGGGLADYSHTEFTIARFHIKDDSYATSSPLPGSRTTTFESNDDITAPLFPTGIVRAAQISVRTCLLVAHVNYYQFENIAQSITNSIDTVSIYTNFAFYATAQATIYEKGGIVYASVTPNYTTIYNDFFAATGYGYPDDMKFPAPPSRGLFPADSEGRITNRRDTSVEIKPKKIGLAIDIAWHSGFGPTRQ